MSSSSDSEDDERFRAICDPTLSVDYNKNESLAGLSEVQLQKTEEELGVEDSRPSFLLLKRIQRCTGNNGGPIIRGRGMGACEKVRRSSDGRSGRKGEADLPSSISKYLAKQLTGILDKNIAVSAGDSSVNELSIQPRIQNGCSFHLVKDVVIENSSQSCEGTNETSSKTKKRKSIKYWDNYDEKQIAAQCQSVAVTPEWILSRSGDYPWPHPKNIRYLEKYRVQERRANGVIVAVPIDEAAKSLNDNGSTASSAFKPKKMKSKETAPGNEGKISDEEQGLKNSISNSTLTNDEKSNSKTRKQSRKRGKKNKNKKEAEECNGTSN
ncbi:uncharacterized protein LOC122267731 [Penaeus japonicus]|uniref:uncharacterized protein LOC122267731 n=1 Tax=Penaeus japonicus TaxID=27405 RepID=UPI001C712B0F|nr:uncharacterized protein LOC122267731 [Penaeus japonicus]